MMRRNHRMHGRVALNDGCRAADDRNTGRTTGHNLISNHTDGATTSYCWLLVNHGGGMGWMVHHRRDGCGSRDGSWLGMDGLPTVFGRQRRTLNQFLNMLWRGLVAHWWQRNAHSMLTALNGLTGHRHLDNLLNYLDMRHLHNFFNSGHVGYVNLLDNRDIDDLLNRLYHWHIYMLVCD